MRLLNKDISTDALLARLKARVGEGRSDNEDPAEPVQLAGPEARVDPLAFHLSGLEEHADATRPLPRHTHRAGLGRLVLVAKWGFRKTCQVFVNEILGRQRLFNGHVRDAYGLLSADLLRLQEEVEALKGARKPRTPH